MDIPKSRQSPLGSHCGGVYTPEIVTQEGLTFVNIHLRVVISRVNMGSNDEKMAGFARRDVTKDGQLVIKSQMRPNSASLYPLWEFYVSLCTLKFLYPRTFKICNFVI